jgi:hypothetical protein
MLKQQSEACVNRGEILARKRRINMATRNKLRHDGKKRYEGTNPRRKPFKVSKVEDAVPNLDARQRATVQQTKSNHPDPNNQTEVGRLGN